MTVPRSEIAIFSTGRRASSKLLEQIADLVLTHNPDYVTDNRVAKNNQESFWVTHPDTNDVAKVNSVRSAAAACARTLPRTAH